MAAPEPRHIDGFRVEGTPAPGGSKRAFRRGNRILIVDACKRNPAWRATVAAAARRHYRGRPFANPLALLIVFWLPRPKKHFDSKGNLRAGVPLGHAIRPDATKLLRSTEDALTGILWEDDAQIVEQSVTKLWAMPNEPPGAWIAIRPALERHHDWHARKQGSDTDDDD